mgnify:CR=1 FL=1
MSDARPSSESDARTSGGGDDGGVDADVEPALRAFLETLTDSETYREFVAADEALREDDEAMALLREYRRKQQQMQRGFDDSVMQELKELQSELSDNETIQRQQAAQDELVELLQRTNDVVSDEIGREFAQSTGGGCC